MIKSTIPGRDRLNGFYPTGTQDAYRNRPTQPVVERSPLSRNAFGSRSKKSFLAPIGRRRYWLTRDARFNEQQDERGLTDFRTVSRGSFYRRNRKTFENEF